MRKLRHREVSWSVPMSTLVSGRARIPASGLLQSLCPHRLANLPPKGNAWGFPGGSVIGYQWGGLGEAVQASQWSGVFLSPSTVKQG